MNTWVVGTSEADCNITQCYILYFKNDIILFIFLKVLKNKEKNCTYNNLSNYFAFQHIEL